MRGRVRLTDGDRLFFIQLYRWFPTLLELDFAAFKKAIRSGRLKADTDEAGGLEVDHELELACLYDWQLRWLIT
ncbi:MAG: hypothetical protein WA720_05110, partial [Pseudolabrys sp.]